MFFRNVGKRLLDCTTSRLAGSYYCRLKLFVRDLQPTGVSSDTGVPVYGEISADRDSFRGAPEHVHENNKSQSDNHLDGGVQPCFNTR
jgi:hypothetical protein